MEEKIKELIKYFKQGIKIAEKEIEYYEQEEYHFKDFDRYMYEKSMHSFVKGELCVCEEIVNKLNKLLESEVENENS